MEPSSGRRIPWWGKLLLAFAILFALVGLLIVALIVADIFFFERSKRSNADSSTKSIVVGSSGTELSVSTEASTESSASPVQATKEDSYRQRAEAGDAEAQYQVGMAYLQKTAGMSMGDAGNSSHAKEAEPWFRKAAEQGHAAAQFQIGNMYWRAWGGLPMDEKQAAIWFRKAAEQGNADGEWQLGELY